MYFTCQKRVEGSRMKTAMPGTVTISTYRKNFSPTSCFVWKLKNSTIITTSWLGIRSTKQFTLAFFPKYVPKVPMRTALSGTPRVE